MKAKIKARKTTPSPVLFKLIALIYLFTCFALGCFYGTAETRALIKMGYQPDLVVVPRYVGMQHEQAVSRMPNDRLRPGEISEVYADTPPGTVIYQFPEPEIRVDPGTLVNLEVSLGPPPERRLEMPNVIGLNVRQAEAVLLESGLQIASITERASNKRENIVLEQSPQAGTVVMENTGVGLVISIRDFQITVPDVRFMHREKAIRILEESRLSHALFYESSGQSEHTVISQNPPPGSRVDGDTVVYLTLAKKQIFSSWLFWGGVIFAALLGGFSGYRLKKSKTRTPRSTSNRLEITFNPKWEPGKQKVNVYGTRLVNSPLRFKFILDSGLSTILKSGK